MTKSTQFATATLFILVLGNSALADGKNTPEEETIPASTQQSNAQAQSAETLCTGLTEWNEEEGACVEVEPAGGKKTKKVKLKKNADTSGSGGVTKDIINLNDTPVKPRVGSAKVKAEGKKVSPLLSPGGNNSMTQEPEDEDEFNETPTVPRNR